MAGARKLRMAVSRCVGCGCDDMRACIDGCWWAEVDRERGIGVCSQCAPRHRVRVFSIGERTWWAGACSAEEILAAYMKATGRTREESMGNAGELPQELTLLQLHQMTFNDRRGSGDKPRTFFETLNEMVESGAAFPCAFAGMGHRGRSPDIVKVWAPPPARGAASGM